jgi:hypothetical protein
MSAPKLRDLFPYAGVWGVPPNCGIFGTAGRKISQLIPNYEGIDHEKQILKRIQRQKTGEADQARWLMIL